MRIRTIAVVILLFTCTFVSGQSKDWKLTRIKMSTLEKSGDYKVWELLPMDTSNIYFIYITLANKDACKKEKKMYSRLIRVARHKKPRGLYLIFQKREIYPIDTSLNNDFAEESNLVIEERGLRSYVEEVEILNPPIKEKLLRKRLLIFNVKKSKKYEVSDY